MLWEDGPRTSRGGAWWGYLVRRSFGSFVICSLFRRQAAPPSSPHNSRNKLTAPSPAARRALRAPHAPCLSMSSMERKRTRVKQTLTVERCWRGQGRQASRAWAIGSPGVAHVDATTARPTSSRPTRRASRRSRRWSGKRTLGEKQTLTVERCWRGRRRALGVISMLPRPHGPRRGRRRVACPWSTARPRPATPSP